MEAIGLSKCDKCGHLMRWGVYEIICQQCGNVRHIEVAKNEQKTDFVGKRREINETA